MGRLEKIGIEKIHAYPTKLSLDLSLLANERGYNVQYLHHELMAFERGVNPNWEDPVTMAVNAANPMLSKQDRDSIGLLIISTETGVDYEKSMSTWVHRYLELPSDCRHFEMKSACYGGTLALKQSLSWLLSGLLPPGKKALIIATDQSLISLQKPWEYVGGACAVAFIVSTQPDFLMLEPNHYGFYTSETCDVIRPLPWLEIGNAEDSLYSYMEGLDQAYQNYLQRVKPNKIEHFFDFMIYHVPFAGISYRAHKQITQQWKEYSKDEILQQFNAKTKPSLYFPQRIGASYGASIFIALLSLIYHSEQIKKDDRIGIFSYGAGYSAEFYSGLVGKCASQVAQKANLKELLNERYKLSVLEYELFEKNRVKMVQEADFSPNFSAIEGLYEKVYQGKKLLIYTGSKNYRREYAWS